MSDINFLIGKTFNKVENKNSEELIFENDEFFCKFYHSNDCCECVEIADVCGELTDLIGSPITQAEEESREATLEEISMINDSGTWTFYKFATIKGSVTVRWLGTSNGYYSESVEFYSKEKNKASEDE